MIAVGTVLYGYCGGHFGRDSFGDKRVEAVGADWIVAREMDTGLPVFTHCVPESLRSHMIPEEARS